MLTGSLYWGGQTSDPPPGGVVALQNHYTGIMTKHSPMLGLWSLNTHVLCMKEFLPLYLIIITFTFLYEINAILK